VTAHTVRFGPAHVVTRRRVLVGLSLLLAAAASFFMLTRFATWRAYLELNEVGVVSVASDDINDLTNASANYFRGKPRGFGSQTAALLGLEVRYVRLNWDVARGQLSNIEWGFYPELRGVSFRSTCARDEDLTALAALQHLEEIDLTDTAITDRAITTLSRIPTLIRIVVPSSITDQGIEQLQQNLPHCMIARGSPSRDGP
jgi:hypothetical protein